MTNKIIILLTIITLLIVSNAFSQVKIKNVQGDEIILMPDGSWKYVDEKKNQKREAQATKGWDYIESDAQKEAAKKEQERLDKLAKQEAKARKQQEKLLAKQKKEAAKRAKKLKAKQQQSSTSKEEQKRLDKIAKQQAKARKQQEKLLAKQKKEAAKRAKMLKTQQQQSSTSKEEQKILDKLAKKEAKRKKKEQEYLDKLAKQQAQQRITKRNAQQQRGLSKEEQKRLDKLAKKEAKRKKKEQKRLENIVKQQAQKKAQQKRATSNPIINNQAVKSSNVTKTKPIRTKKVKYVPKVATNCTFAYDDIDEFTGRRKRGLESCVFFNYTNPAIKKFMKNDAYLSCEGALSEITGLKVLNLAFIINSTNAKKEYGAIQEGNALILKLIDGSSVQLISNQYDPGVVDKRENQTIYRTYYVIGSKAEKTLRNMEISKVRMVWSVGYEDYEVYELDFLIDQFNCLDQNK